ncbi:hypothetical protein MUDAN_DOGOELCO_03377 [Lactiplantibacillus mudanjiangensis]|uniref:hypothetical protein n=1 Tax=Lactiplantibacillus mudanjiangensis TaxID=1296538 RepID=UPI001015ADDA|nr:hypothetical protein [Lactiplantibacillus mudanjiangensis]VDG31532.1 hypothetical protein MUDAN_DOGOELCO_03377 [Lactiplantibacillus mudanjiangensis]
MGISVLKKLAAVYDCKVKVESDRVVIVDQFNDIHASVDSDAVGVYEVSTWMGSGFPEVLANAVISFLFSDIQARMRG